jgi:hypothetical protein
MSTETRITVTGLLFAVKFAAGFWLTRSGKPYSVIVLTIHKIISLAIVAMIGIIIYRLRRDVGIDSAEIVALAITGLLFLLMIASGGLVSTDRPANAAILTVHRAVPFLTVLSTAVTLYLTVWGK